MAVKSTVFQALDRAINGNWQPQVSPHVNSYDLSSISNKVLYQTDNKADYEQKKLELKQDKYLKDRWVKANVNLSVAAYAGLGRIQLMYRDADFMDSSPEIGAALDIVSEESVLPNPIDGCIVNIYSKSDRVKRILEDLFVNRLNIQLTGQMIIRAMCKYGNQFMLLDVDHKNGVKGWKQLPVAQVERIENGIRNPYGAGVIVGDGKDVDMSTQFVWTDENSSVQAPFRDWQVAHFRLLNNSMFLPYGCLVGDTRIETETGYKEMSNIQIGDKVWTFNTETQERELGEVTMFMPKGEKDVYRVGTFHNEIEGTSDHKLLVYEGNTLKYKEIGQLEIDDLIIIDNSTNKQNSKIAIDKSYPTDKEANLHKTMKWWNDYIEYIPDYVDSEFAKFFGFMIGDGWITYNKDVFFATGVYDKFNIEFAEYISKITNHKYKFTSPRFDEYKADYSQCIVSSKCLALIMHRMGFIDGFDKKRIPSWVFASNDKIKKQFLRGVMIADGSYNIDKYGVLRCSIEMSNEQLIRDLKALVQSLGYKSSKINCRNRIGHSVKLKNGYVVCTKNTSYYFYYYESFNRQETKYDISDRKAEGFKTEKVRRIEYVGKKQTYDFTVNNDNSNFFANGIVTHNCSYLNPARRSWRMLSLMEDMMFLYRLERSMERRVYKIFVGAIDDADVPAYVEKIANEFKRTPIIDPQTGQVDLRKNVLPVHKDTPIPLLDGRTLTIEQLAQEYNDGKENYVYSVQDETHQIVPGKVVWCGKNYTADSLLKITLDDGSHMIIAPEHEIVMRDGSKKRADEVQLGESVMPLYRNVDKNSKKLFDRYEKVYNPSTGKFEFTHRLVGKCLEKGDEKYNTIHHKDFNKYNNNPTNLLWMDYHEHHKMHGDLARALWKDEEKRKIHCEHLSQACKGRTVSEETKAKMSKTRRAKYASGELDYVREIARKNLEKVRQTDEYRQKARERGLKLGYRKEFETYNNSDLHKEHDEIRRNTMKEYWASSNKVKQHVRNMRVEFDDYIWSEIESAVIRGEIYSQFSMIQYINDNLIDYLKKINASKKLQNYSKVTKPSVHARIQEHGFANCDEYLNSLEEKYGLESHFEIQRREKSKRAIEYNFSENFRVNKKKNHKITSIEVVGGDDVYCMTVAGLNGEEDRHNFALLSWKEDGSVNDSGVFVSNCVDSDLFIPVRNESAPTPIDTLSAGQNMTALDDIKYVQNKICAALRIPRTFLNFEETAGDGKNLALMDIRFTRTINRIQQAFLMELTKVATIHLFLLGFDDELTNFTLSMNNPSTQAEQLEIENLQKKIGAVRDAVSDPGNGIPAMSLVRALKQIMKWSEKDIKENLEEIRLEKGLAAELEKTTQIIKKTGIFDSIDRIYGEPGAEYMNDQQGGQGGMDGGPGGGGGGPMGGGGPTDFGEELGGMDDVGADDSGEIAGNEGAAPVGDMDTGTEAAAAPMEGTSKNGNLILDDLMKKYVETLKEDKAKGNILHRAEPHDMDKFFMNEEMDKMRASLMEFVNEKNNLD